MTGAGAALAIFASRRSIVGLTHGVVCQFSVPPTRQKKRQHRVAPRPPPIREARSSASMRCWRYVCFTPESGHCSGTTHGNARSCRRASFRGLAADVGHSTSCSGFAVQCRLNRYPAYLETRFNLTGRSTRLMRKEFDPGKAAALENQSPKHHRTIRISKGQQK